MKTVVIYILILMLVSSSPLCYGATSEFVLTVGTDASGTPIQQVEWLYSSADLKEQKCPIWSGSVVEVIKQRNGVVMVKCDKSALPDQKKWQAAISSDGSSVIGWIKKELLIKVSLTERRK